MNVLLKRISQTETETFGVIMIDNAPICLTVELPWRDNKPDISCIPVGEYNCTKIGPTQKFPYQHFSINTVPDRANVRIHRGNWTSDTEGCVLVGRQFGPHCVSLSQMALDDLISILPDTFTLTIGD